MSETEGDVEEKRAHTVKRTGHGIKERRYKRLVLLLTKPSYTLAFGSQNARHENRFRLRYLLRKLVARHNWVEASGVLSVLLKGTSRERSLQNNRIKYVVALELLGHMESDPNVYTMKIEHLYRSWLEKVKSYKGRPMKDRCVTLDYILSYLTQKKHEIAYNASKRPQQDSDSSRDPMSDLVIGLTNYELWYSDLVDEMRRRNLDEHCMPMESETVEDNSFGEIEDMKGEDGASIDETCSNLPYNTETSVVNDKDDHANLNQELNREASRAYAHPQVHHNQSLNSQGFHMNSVETSEENDGSVQDRYGQIHNFNTFNVHGLESLLPLRMPFPSDMEDFLSSHRGFSSDFYKDALKYLKLALESSPPISEAALLPLIQLLLFGDQVNEAFLVLKNFCNKSNSVLPYRLRARLCECFDGYNYEELSSCFEDIMKKDPTCRHSLTRLVDLHQRGEYAPERLVEMIALHLEATYTYHIAWREFASCLLKLSQCEEDRMSFCMDGEQVENKQRRTTRFSQIPLMFVEGLSGKTWKLRCRWWLTRHFSKQVLSFEVDTGDWKLMAYKAACASHLYGKDTEYVTRVHTCIKEHDRTLLPFLYTHMENSFGFFNDFVKK